MASFYKENRVYLILFASTVVTLLISIILQNIGLDFIASIFCNIFAGMVTGCVLAVISAYKNRSKGKYVLLKTAYESVYNCNMEFLNNSKYDKYLLDDYILYEEIYSKLSYLKFINEYIEKYKNEYLPEGELPKIFAEKFSYQIEKKEKEYIQLHDDLQSNIYNTKKELLELVRKYEIEIIRLNAKIMMEIGKCNEEIYKIDQSFI